MTQWRNWLKLVRTDTLFAALLALGSYPIMQSRNVVFPVIAVAEIFAATMIWNAYYDRVHDAIMGRTFAKKNEATLRLLTIYAWVVVGATLLLAAVLRTWWEFCILLGMAVGGFVYAWCRLVPGLSMLMVATVFTAPLLLGMQEHTVAHWLNLATFFAFILVAELRGDLRDWIYDRVGYWKKTVPVMLGTEGGMVTHIVLSIVPCAFQIIRGSQEYSPFGPPISAFDILMGTAIFFTTASSVTLILPFKFPEKLRQSGLLQKAAMTCFVVAFLLD